MDAMPCYACGYVWWKRWVSRIDISSFLHVTAAIVGKLWIPATIVNIAFIKPILRVLFDNLVFFIWTIFLSMMLND
jgi:hypothetical protein